MNSPSKFDFRGSDQQRIAVEYFSQDVDPSEKIYIEQHLHDFYELIYVKSGMCEHIYNDTTVTLMANDVLLIDPGQSHEFSFYEEIEIYNCQFFKDAVEESLLDTVNQLSHPSLRTEPAIARRQIYTPINQQGVIHISMSQAMYFESLLKKIIEEHNNGNIKHQRIVRNTLEEILIILERIVNNQFRNKTSLPKKNNALIEDILRFIDLHYQEDLNFDDIASAQNLSPNYFRKIFKIYTGTSPVGHLNRIRIMKALELLRTSHYPVGDIAAEVGIYDANYFSRLFKKYLGYPPSHFMRN